MYQLIDYDTLVVQAVEIFNGGQVGNITINATLLICKYTHLARLTSLVNHNNLLFSLCSSNHSLSTYKSFRSRSSWGLHKWHAISILFCFLILFRSRHHHWGCGEHHFGASSVDLYNHLCHLIGDKKKTSMYVY